MLRALLETGGFVVAMVAACLPYRLWRRLPATIRVEPAAFVSGIATLLLGAAIGIPGFLDHAHATASLGLDAALKDMNRTEVYRGDLVIGFTALSLFTFLLLTAKGWLTLYLIGSGGVRAGGAWFDDPIGDPALTLVDYAVTKWTRRHRARLACAEREAREGPEIPDRLVSAASAGVAPCDVVVVASRRKADWEPGATVFTSEGAYRVGEAVETTVAGRLRTLYPLTAHNDLEAVRRSVRYELPARPDKPE